MYARRQQYDFRLFDQTLFCFTLFRNDFFWERAVIDDVDESCRHLLPLKLFANFNEQTLVSWIESRVALPSSRPNVCQLYLFTETPGGNLPDFIEVSHCLSLNDSYWIVETGSKLTFDQVNLYENDYDEALSIIAYTGVTEGLELGSKVSPEWTTDGTFAKAWRRVEGKPHLYKSGCRRSHGQDCTLDMAPFSEFFAAQLGEFLGLDVVSYDLVDWHDAFGSSCPLLNDIDVSFVSFYDAAHAVFWPQAGVVCALADKVLLERFVTMVVFDSLIVNPDRHGKNHGFLRDNHTGKIVGYAPLFDHNLALFARHSDLSADEMFERAHRTFPALAYSDFLSLDGMVLGEAQREMLLRAKEFEFQNHPDFPVSDQRLGALNEFLAKRVDELLRIPVADHSLLFDCLCKHDYAGSTQAPLLELYAAKG